MEHSNRASEIGFMQKIHGPPRARLLKKFSSAIGPRIKPSNNAGGEYPYFFIARLRRLNTTISPISIG
jgi:hypothetical protein